MKAKKTNQTRKTPITIRRTDQGFRVNSRSTNFRKFDRAFEAAWKDCRRQNRALYTITPDGDRIPMLSAKTIREFKKSGL